MISNRQIFLQNIAQTSASPMMLEIERGEGIYLYNTSGKKYIDLISGINVSVLGHCHPAVVNAIQEQSTKYMHSMVYGEYVLSPQVELAKFLSDRLPEKLNNIYFTNSGTEATEGAMKIAKRFTGRTEIISFEKSYHGSTQGALSILGDEHFKSNYRPLIPDTRLIRYNHFEDLEKITERTAAVFLEPVQAESGITIPAAGFIQAVRKRCDETGTLLVLDEVQTGCGRTGSFFAFEQMDIVPDILLLGKGLGGGMPIGAFISSKEMMSVIMDNPALGHITTFGGNAVCCAAALAVLQTLSGNNYIREVPEKEKLFLENIHHPAIRNISSFGLMMAIHLDNFEQVQKVITQCLADGLITDWFLFAPNCIRIAPPLIITNEQILEACKILNTALEKTFK